MSRTAVVALIVGTGLVVSVSACGSPGTARAIGPCSLLTADEVSAAAGSTFTTTGQEVPSEATPNTLGCGFRSTRGGHNLRLEIGAGGPPGAARALGTLAATRLP